MFLNQKQEKGNAKRCLQCSWDLCAKDVLKSMDTTDLLLIGEIGDWKKKEAHSNF